MLTRIVAEPGVKTAAGVERGLKPGALVLAALLIAVCAAVSSAAAPAPSPANGDGLNDGSTKAPSTLKKIDRAALQAMVDKTATELMAPGALVLLRTPEGDFTVSYGTTELGAASPPTADTHFRIASNTKTITAALIMLLAEEGKLRLDDPVSKYVPGVPNGDKITIAELLEMRSGLYNYTAAPELSESMDRDPARARTPAELLAIAFKRPPGFQPGAEYEYNNTNYALLGLIVEKLNGKPLAEVMKERLFEPLGMKQTYLPESADTAIPEPYTHGYGYGSVAAVLTDDAPYPPDIVAAARAGTLKPKDFTGLNHSFAWAAGGVISTANDMATWIEALVSGKVLDAEYQRKWLGGFKPQDPDKPDGQQYGYGIVRLSWGPNTIYFHGGETVGYNSKISYDPANRTTLVIWTSLAVSLDGQQPANTLMVNVLDQIYELSPLAAPAPGGKNGR
ncbi:MAG: beta-lactamase family protein [Candidatus Dadabacteria bacterium]|nr:beta-lactamase family protein [Candidatus Dadabacteria bacterium]